MEKAAKDGEFRKLNKHYKAVTCLALSADGAEVFSGGKDGSIARWSAREGKRKALRRKAAKENAGKGHRGAVLCLALSGDDKILVSGGTERFIFIWEPKEINLMHVLKGHQNSIVSLAFAQDSFRLYSGSTDHSIRAWNLTLFAFIEKLHGHSAAVTALAPAGPDRVLSCAEDRTVRLFKIATGTQLVFNALNVHSGALDCVCPLGKRQFAVGAQDGAVSLWDQGRKTPLAVVKEAHGGKWITAIAEIPSCNIDVIQFATGSSDGFVRFWKIIAENNDVNDSLTQMPGGDSNAKENIKRDTARSAVIEQTKSFAVNGFVNAIKFGEKQVAAGGEGENGPFEMFIAVGKEHRLGRWEVVRDAENFVFVAQVECG